MSRDPLIGAIIKQVTTNTRTPAEAAATRSDSIESVPLDNSPLPPTAVTNARTAQLDTSARAAQTAGAAQ